MRCPRCGHEEDRVIDSRAVREGKGVRRRRECMSCGHRYTTYEYVDAVTLLVVKRDGRRETYQREKVKQGIMRACRKRPVGAAAIEALVERVESHLQRTEGGEIATRTIGSRVMEGLKDLDPVAYVRFASVYRRFESVQEFVQIVEGIGTDESEPPGEGDPAAEVPDDPPGPPASP